MLMCDSCGLAYHLQCLRPPLQVVPSGETLGEPAKHADWVKHLVTKVSIRPRDAKNLVGKVACRKRGGSGPGRKAPEYGLAGMPLPPSASRSGGAPAGTWPAIRRGLSPSCWSRRVHRCPVTLCYGCGASRAWGGGCPSRCPAGEHLCGFGTSGCAYYCTGFRSGLRSVVSYYYYYYIFIAHALVWI